ncbi:metallopeptidase TldD-related protein [Caldisalinibacter kiritimatiensis]|uniref:TldE/PmbA protein, part of proposed TldE/TldD proteolytic complex n=1 Tax=Caldisalinibacter kiritimatiensis TaxID=1304284 RepID=R1AWZ6_9FIRM|nr:metallopeptidase TldD-related protein [Caldisalinibacter kiritimatiensis]EOD01182.1 TldE/PmbA protein, part of proposed TldE/TldD proteolytic complex [Caldisalinibacter kiritimatiensis]
MLDKIKNILSQIKEIDDWSIIEKKVESSELFFIKKELDMNRGKKVHHFKVTVYKDFNQDGKKYKGSSTINIHPTMNESEIKTALEKAAFAAKFVKNEFYSLVEPSEEKPINVESKFENGQFSDWLPKLTDAIYKEDVHDNGAINSAELFLNKIYTRNVNSKGLDVNYTKYKGELEFITNWKEQSEEIELYKDIKFADFAPEMISEKVKEMLLFSKQKAIAKPTPSLNKIPVILTGEPIQEFLNYYYIQSNGRYVYEGISTLKLNENVQGDSVEGDLISLRLDPNLKNSTESAPYDKFGTLLKPVSIIKKGILNKYWADNRYAQYIGINPTGEINNIVFEGGSKSVKDFKQKPYLELIAFSDFQMNPLTGDFGGEIRLGFYFNGKETIPVTGGSISGNINEVKQKMYLSKEIQENNNFVGPKSIQLFNVTIAS